MVVLPERPLFLLLDAFLLSVYSTGGSVITAVIIRAGTTLTVYFYILPFCKLSFVFVTGETVEGNPPKPPLREIPSVARRFNAHIADRPRPGASRFSSLAMRLTGRRLGWRNTLRQNKRRLGARP